MFFGSHKHSAQATYIGDKTHYVPAYRLLHILILFLGGLAVLGLVVPDTPQDLSPEKSALPPGGESMDTIALRIPEQLASPDATSVTDTPAERLRPLPKPRISDKPEGVWHEISVKAGDTLSSIFGRLNILAELSDVISSAQAKKDLRFIHPGQRLRIRIHANSMEELIYKFDKITSLHVTRGTDGFTSKRVSLPLETRQTVATGKINHSLYRAGIESGLSDRLIMDLINLFGWDIDFALDIRQGDSFTVLYEDLYNNGEKVGAGKIIAAEFHNQGQIHQAFSYTNQEGRTEFFSSAGRSMRKAFLRTPVSFARISSRFSLGRKHPILNNIRAHKGVDYAAPVGTPIKAAGDGKVVFRGRKGGYGKTIILKHGEKYSTLYAHMSRFNRSAERGGRVKQGQIIGYVGKTGLATGPHLHYEFRVSGVHRNPLTVELPSAKPLPSPDLAKFTAKIKPIMAQLELYRNADIALNDR